MKSITDLSPDQLRNIAGLKSKIESLQNQISRILGSPARSDGAPQRPRTMSAAGRARIVAAQKARWAKVKGKKDRKPRRTMSAAARAKIAAIAKARWARVKASGKKRL